MCIIITHEWVQRKKPQKRLFCGLDFCAFFQVKTEKMCLKKASFDGILSSEYGEICRILANDGKSNCRAINKI